MRLINRLFLALLSCALSVGVFAQTEDSTVVAAKDSVAPKKTKVFLEHANTLSFDKERNAEAQVLNGDVCFRHDSSYMYCDSAYFFEQTNSLEAFSNVRMEQGDTLFVYGNYLFYDGNTQIAYLRENVRMENGQVTLFTDSLNYERIPDIGYYFDGGLIVDSLNQLSSFTGNIRLVRNWLSSMIASVWRMSNSRCIPIPCIIIRTRRSPRSSGPLLSCRIAARSILPEVGTIP